MPSRKVYSRWDLVWMLDSTMERRQRVRFAGRLGRKRPLWERLFRGSRFVPVTVLIVIWIAAGSLISLRRTMPPEPLGAADIIGVIGYLACLAGVLSLMGAGEDVRCVVSAHERKRLAENPDRRAVASEITRRRRRWETWMKEWHSLKAMLTLRSIAFRASIVVFFVSSGILQMWRAHANLSAFGRSVENALTILYGVMLVLMLATGMWTWKRIKRMLSDSLRGEACPDCGHPIVAGEVVTVLPGMGVAIGPPRCSECGCAWPLIPPQILETA
ncbi:MAG: hypothetical protein KF805_05340 [Phycisphaeraceae bacterium]|nr:hypothetical protein [Phycisphaeraceae bacterium]